MAKAQPLEEVYAETMTALETAANVEQLQALGQAAWRTLVPLLQGGGDEPWVQFDELFHETTRRISRATNRPAIERVWHHCHYLAPTPVIGTVVHCRLPNNKKLFAAHVVGILQPPGTIEISLIRGGHDQGIPQFYEPVTHVTHPQHDTKQLVKWDYLPGVMPSEEDWLVAKGDIAQREKWHIDALAREEQARKDQAAAQRAAKKQQQQPELVS